MAYPRNLLSPGETVVIDSHPHWKALLGPVIIALLAVTAMITTVVWTGNAAMSDTARTTILIVVAVVLGIIVIWWALSPFIRWFATHFVVTDRRVIYRSGVFTKSGIDIPIARIATVQFRHGMIDRMFRTGKLIVESASDDPLEFDDIPDVEKVHARLYEIIIDAIESDDDRRGSRETPTAPPVAPPATPQSPPAPPAPPQEPGPTA
ncbi:PH domain-containing protein [Demequina lignilytica]|uniref:PH domain-containing protein n=1 Tax=Demequina lignilytica TaxID=3051663 RepID=A0AB35MF51_9MICO|nr:PH domain-containing protein [Demequina sp. SYSU T0a273]MDN4482397.1 PH domain-containing protein [Demequina sp. SYSU T0a273]